MPRLTEAVEQIAFVRRYTLERLATVPFADWFTIPSGGVSHIAWQVGHITMAEYRLCLERQRPRSQADEAMISDDFLRVFGRESEPANVTAFTAEEIRKVFEAVHARVLEEAPTFADPALDLPVLKPHPLLATRIAALRYAPLHEMLHCGQIALIRRMLGQKPIW